MRGRQARLRASAVGVVLLVAVGTMAACDPPPPPPDPLPAATIEHDWAFASQRLAAMAGSLAPTAYPQRTSGSSWFTVPASDWTTGFFPGLLWLMFERTDDPVWRVSPRRTR